MAQSIGWAFRGLDTGTPRARPGGRKGAGRMGVHEGTGVSSDLKDGMASSGCAGQRDADPTLWEKVKDLECLRKLKH